MLFMSRESRLNKRLEKQVIPAIEEIVHAPLHDVLEISATRISEMFETPYACIHFSEGLGLSWENALPALKFCPVATLSGETQKAMLSIEGRLNNLAANKGPQIHKPDLPIDQWDSFMGYFGLNSGITVPLKYQEETFGFIHIYHKRNIDFSKIELSPLIALGSCLYGAVKKEVMIKSLEERDDVIEAFARTIEAADRYTGGHVDRVSNYALIIGKALNLNHEDLKSLKRSALLHDIGKIGVPGSILNKPGPLTNEERAVMEKHPEIAKDIFGPVTDPRLKRALDGILFHHERMDGKGYPYGLPGEDIPLSARIIAIADTYDALTSDRPYRKGMDKDKAVGILKECRGAQLDPKLVDLFLNEVNN